MQSRVGNNGFPCKDIRLSQRGTIYFMELPLPSGQRRDQLQNSGGLHDLRRQKPRKQESGIRVTGRKRESFATKGPRNSGRRVNRGEESTKGQLLEGGDRETCGGLYQEKKLIKSSSGRELCNG